MQEIIDQSEDFSCELKSFNLREEHPDHFLSRYVTKFEKIFIEQGTHIKAFVLTKKSKHSGVKQWH